MADDYEDYKPNIGKFIEVIDIGTGAEEEDKKDESGDSIKAYAQMLQDLGGEDSILAHITPDEADILKMLGGSGDVSALTSLLMFNPLGPQVEDEEYEENLNAQLMPIAPIQPNSETIIESSGPTGDLRIPTGQIFGNEMGAPDYETTNDIQSKYYWGTDRENAPDQPFGLQQPFAQLTAADWAPPQGLDSGTTGGGGKSMGPMGMDPNDRKRLFG